MLPRVHSATFEGPVVREPPQSPRPRTPGPFSGVTTSHSSMPSTAATQIVSRAGSSPPPLMIDPSIREPFLLYGPSGRLLNRYEPTDLWGLLVSEHTTLNCTYAHTMVRVGRAGCCDTTLVDPRVSSTHFTIALELEPFGSDANTDGTHQRHSSSGPSALSSGEWGEGVEGDEERAVMAAREGDAQASRATPTARRRRGRGRNVSQSTADADEEKVPPSSASNSRSSNPLPGWRVRRVVLNDCSANGTYVNDVLVGRGEYCELHYGDDISIVRVTEKKRRRRDSITPTAQSSDDDDGDGEGRGWTELGNENEEDTRWTGRGGGDSSSAQRRTAAKATAPTASLNVPGTARQRKGRRSAGEVPEPEAQRDHAPHRGSDDDPRVTQMLTALLSTLSTEHTYVERFCFHLYHAEEVGRGGMPVIEPESVAVAASAAAGAAAAPASIMKGLPPEPPQPASDLLGVQRVGAESTPPLPRRLPPTPLQLRFDTDGDEGGRTSTAGSVQGPQQQQQQQQPHHKSVRFPEYPVTAYDSPPRSGDDNDDEVGGRGAHDSPPIAPAPSSHRDRRGSGASAFAAGALPPLAPVSADQPLSSALTPAHGTRSRASSTGSTRALSAVVTPHSLLRPRPSIRESFIAPIALPDREGSTASSSGSHHGATASSAALRFHESIGVGPALQRKVAALATRRAGSTASTSSNQTTATTGSVSTISAIMRDVPADMPIRYAVLPLRHLQWGGRIGFGASGEVFMGIDVSTATVVAIKVLKGGPLFQPPSTPSDEEVVPPHAAPTAAAAAAAAGRTPLDDENTILALTNVSLGPCDLTAPTPAGPRGAPEADILSGVSISSASPTTGPPSGSEGRQRDMGGGSHAQADFANEESLEVSADSPSSAEGRTSTAVVAARATTRDAVLVAEQSVKQTGPPRRDEHPASPLLRKHLREIIFLTTLQHHRIVRFLGFQFSEDGRLCLLMEYVAGGTLQTLIKNFGAFEENVIRLYTLQILEGLEYLKRKGVVHGDLKSANILVSEQGSVKLTDFGTSRFLTACSAEERSDGHPRHSSEDAQEEEEEVVAAKPRGQPAARQRGSHPHQQHRDPRRVAANEATPTAGWGDAGGGGGSARGERGGESGANSAASESSGGDEDDGSGGSAGDGADNEDDDEQEEDGDVEVEEDTDWGETEDEGDVPHNRVLCGTPLYMSPELIRTQDPSFASDMWALGCVVFEMATGGVLPWRKVHNMTAAAVVWYIGQREEPRDGPSLIDVFAARAKMNPDDSGDDGDGASAMDMEGVHGGEEPGSSNIGAYEDRSQRSSSGSYASSGACVGRWGRTPSPLLIDLLQVTLHMNAAMRPTPAELLQHPFIRNEASDVALERWHAMVAANRRGVLPVLAPRERTEPGAGGEAEDAAQVREVSGSQSRATLRSVRGSKAGSPFETAVVLATSSSASRDGSLRHRASVSPVRTTPPSLQEHHDHAAPAVCVEEVDEGDALAREKNLAAGELAGRAAPATPQPPLHLRHAPCCSTPSTGTWRSNGARSSGSGGPLIGGSWEDVESFSLSPLPAVASQTRGGTHAAPNAATSQSPSVLGAGNPDSQPLIAEPPRRPPAAAARQRMDLPPPVTAMAATAAAMGAPVPLPVPQQPLMYTGPQWWGPQSFSAPPKVPLPRSRAGAPPPSQRPVAYSMPTTPASMPPGMSTSYMRQHQLFLKQNEQERRRLSLSAPQGTRQTRGRHRTEGAAPLGFAFDAAPVFPPSYQYAVQQPVFDYAPGYSDYNAHVNTQTVEMRLPPGFASQSLSTSQHPYTAGTQPSQRKGQHYGSGTGGSQGVSGVHLHRVPASQATPSQASRASQRKKKKGQASGRHERGRAGGAPDTTLSPPLQPQSPGGGGGGRPARGPVLPSMSLPFAASAPTSAPPSMQPPHPALGGLTMEVGNLTLSSPQSVHAFAQMPSFTTSVSTAGPALTGTAYTGAPGVASAPVLLHPPGLPRHLRSAGPRPPTSSADIAAAEGGAPPSPPLAAMAEGSSNASGVLSDAPGRQRQRRHALASSAVLGRRKHRLRPSHAVAPLQQQRQQRPRQPQRQQRNAARRLRAGAVQRAGVGDGGGGGGGGNSEHTPPLSPQANKKERAHDGDGDARAATQQETRGTAAAPASGSKRRLRTSTRVTSRAATRQQLQRRRQQQQQQRARQRSASPEAPPKQTNGG